MNSDPYEKLCGPIGDHVRKFVALVLGRAHQPSRFDQIELGKAAEVLEARLASVPDHAEELRRWRDLASRVNGLGPACEALSRAAERIATIEDLAKASDEIDRQDRLNDYLVDALAAAYDLIAFGIDTINTREIARIDEWTRLATIVLAAWAANHPIARRLTEADDCPVNDYLDLAVSEATRVSVDVGYRKAVPIVVFRPAADPVLEPVTIVGPFDETTSGIHDRIVDAAKAIVGAPETPTGKE